MVRGVQEIDDRRPEIYTRGGGNFRLSRRGQASVVTYAPSPMSNAAGKTEAYISDRQCLAGRKYLVRDHIPPGSRRPVRHDHFGILPNLSSQREFSLRTRWLRNSWSHDQGPLPLMPPGKGDDVVPESSRRLQGQICAGPEDLPMGLFWL